MGEVADQVVTDRYALWNGDAMEVMPGLPDGFAHLVVYSPPFAYGEEGPGGGGLYKYSSSVRDLSNAGGYSEFLRVYRFFVAELYRLLVPGRVCAVHCMDTPMSNSGGDALADFPGDLIRVHQEAGFAYTGRHVIWKEPLAVRNRTMTKDLTHKTIVESAELGGVAGADYLLVFRKRGVSPVPVTHPRGFTEYFGASQPPAEVAGFRGWAGSQLENKFSQWVWQQYASSVWDDIRGNLGRWDDRQHDAVLPFRPARDPEDERHVHPLQLDVICRLVDMRTNPGERVFSPFMGVGSEVWAAVRLGRLGAGAELKPSYFRQAVRNLEALDAAGASADGPGDEQLF